MADRYWVTGGTGLFNSTTNWSVTSGGASGASIPTSADIVYFDANSGSGVANAGAGTAYTFQDMILTGFTGTLSGTNTGTTSTITLTSGSSFTVSPTMTWGYAGTLVLNQTNTNYILTTNGKTIGGITVGTSNNIVLGGALTFDKTLTVNGGFDTANFTVTALNYTVFNSGSKIKLNGSTWFSAGFFQVSSSSTFDAGTSTISFTLNGGYSANFFYPGGKTYNKVIAGVTGINYHYIFEDGTVNEFEVNPLVINLYLFANFTVNILTASGFSLTFRLQIFGQRQGNFSSGHRGGNVTLTVNTWATKQFIDFRDIKAAGPLIPWTGTSFGDCQGNSDIIFPAPKTVYWNLAGSNNSNHPGWALTSGGTPAAANLPLAHDPIIIDNNSAGTTLTLGGAHAYNFKSVDTSTRTTPFELVAGQGIMLYGNWNTGSGITYTNRTASRVGFAGKFPQTVSTNGKIFPEIYLQSDSTLELLDPVTTSEEFTIEHGTLITNSFPIQALSLSFGAGTLTTRGAQFGTSAINITGTGTVFSSPGNTNLTISGSPNIKFSNATTTGKTFSSGSTNLSIFTVDQAGPGALTFTGSPTIGDITNSYGTTGATSILFTSGTSTTFNNWNASGTAGKLLTVKSTSLAAHTLSKSSGTVNAEYLELRYSQATGGATWLAATSVNLGNNTGWNITGTLATSNFFLLFM